MSVTDFAMAAFIVAGAIVSRKLADRTEPSNDPCVQRQAIAGPYGVGNLKRCLAGAGSPLALDRSRKTTKYDHKLGAKSVNDDYWSDTAKWNDGDVFGERLLVRRKSS